MVLRKIVHIDAEKCTGCGLCVPKCAEGALRIVDGKARLVSEVYCDGLGACLGECPVGAITIEERDAEGFDGEAVKKYLGSEYSPHRAAETTPLHPCPSAQVVNFSLSTTKLSAGHLESKLSNWPIQLTLVPPQAPFLKDTDLVIAADCVPFAYANFHNEFLEGRSLIIGCPKLDDVQFYKERLTQIFRANNIRGVSVVNMEVPCCFGLLQAVRQAMAASGRNIPLRHKVVSIRGRSVLSDSTPSSIGGA